MNESLPENIIDNETQSVMLRRNVFIVWKPEYLLSIPIIDEQHRGIVTIINSLHYGMQSDYVKNMLAPIIDMMYSYTHIHFQIEENYLQKIHSPSADRHKTLHLELASKLTQAQRDSLMDKDHHQFMDFLKQWLINHICKEDLIFLEHLSLPDR